MEHAMQFASAVAVDACMFVNAYVFPFFNPPPKFASRFRLPVDNNLRIAAQTVSQSAMDIGVCVRMCVFGRRLSHVRFKYAGLLWI